MAAGAPSPDWDAGTVVAWLEAHASPENRAGMARFGIRADRTFGVPLAELRPILDRLDAQEPALSPCCDTALPVSRDLFADTPGYRANASVAQPGH